MRESLEGADRFKVTYRGSGDRTHARGSLEAPDRGEATNSGSRRLSIMLKRVWRLRIELKLLIGVWEIVSHIRESLRAPANVEASHRGFGRLSIM